eukprot:11051662-Karenia_brevis.AAC.1
MVQARQWWQEATQWLQQLRSSLSVDWPCILYLDANARTPAADFIHFGDYGYTNASATTGPFARFVCSNHLVAPSTFSPNVDADLEQGTYYWSKDEGPVRIDFILQSENVEVVPASIGS